MIAVNSNFAGAYWWYRKRSKNFKRKKVYIETKLSPNSKVKTSPVTINITEDPFSDTEPEAKEDFSISRLHTHSPSAAELGNSQLSFDSIVLPFASASLSPVSFTPKMQPVPYDSIIRSTISNPLASDYHKIERGSDVTANNTARKKLNFSDSTADNAVENNNRKSLSIQDTYANEKLNFSLVNPMSAMSSPIKDSSVGRSGSTILKPISRKGLPQKMNHAILLIKPHAICASIKYLVTATLETSRVKIVSSKSFTGKDIHQKKLFDKHFSAAMRYSGEIKSRSINFSVEECQKASTLFGESLTVIAQSNRLMTINDACEHLKISETIMLDICKLSIAKIMLRNGLHITQVDGDCVDDIMSFVYPDLKSMLSQPTYIINAFLNSTRVEYEDPNSITELLSIEWDGNQLPWSQFLSDIVGDCDPAMAIATSLRGTIYMEWKKFGLTTPPTQERNCFHVSSSEMEGFVDRFNWVSDSILFSDVFGSRLIAANIPSADILKWLVTNPLYFGKSVLDHMTGLDSDNCIAKALTLRGLHTLFSISYI